jgi:SNF2 family DNA or RNA helicase
MAFKPEPRLVLTTERDAKFVPKLQAFVYQVEAVEAIRSLEYAAVFHEQGLGKTKIGVDLILDWLRTDTVDSVVVVTKRGLIQNWKDELAAHSFIEPRILAQNRRANFYAFNSPARLYLTHYEVFRKEQKRLALFLKTRRVGIVLDEAHKIKNPESAITKVFFDLAPGFRRRVVMTGTPVANRPYDIWAQIFFLDFGKALGTDFNEFKSQLDLSNKLAFDRHRVAAFEHELASLFGKIDDFSVRSTKQSAGLKLPQKEIHNVTVQLEERQREIYDRFRNDCAAIVVKDGKPQLDDADEILKRLLRLVQVASNPRLVDDSYHGTPGKLPTLVSLVEQIVDAGEKVIVWTSFTENADWLRRELEPYGAVKVHGKMSYDDRNAALHAFKTDGDARVLIATPGAAKEGLTLTVANHAIFYDRSFSLDDYLQAQDRIHRISQNKKCYVTNLTAADTVDAWVEVLLSAKRLAAMLAQGDITKAQYESQASYAFGEMVRDVLRLGDSK